MSETTTIEGSAAPIVETEPASPSPPTKDNLTPEQAESDPVDLHQTAPELAEPSPAEPSPAVPELLETDAGELESAVPESAAPESVALESAEPEIQYRTIVSFDPDEDLSAVYAETMVPVVEGQLVSGTVVQVDDDEVLLDIGFKSEGVIPSRELSLRRDVTTHDLVKLGDEVEAAVLHREDREGRLILSKKRAQYERAWDTISKIKEEGGMVKGIVIEAVKGGLIVDVGLRGFLPASLVELRRVRDLEPYLGQTLEAKILEIDRTRNNVVLSRRDWLQENQREQREHFLDNLKVGERCQGVVASIVSFGAFVDMGGMDGLVHVSELSWKHINHPSDVVKVGDEVEVVVLEVDHERERVSLSLRATQRDPWEEFSETHQVGELVYGRITKLVSFGAFVQVGEVVEGLVHISELSTSHVDSASQVVTSGEELWVKIIEIDLERRRISLSVKQAAEGGTVAAEYQEHFGEHAFDDEGNFIGFTEDSIASDADEAWAEYYAAQQEGHTPSEAAQNIAYEIRDTKAEAKSTGEASGEASVDGPEESSGEAPSEEPADEQASTEVAQASAEEAPASEPIPEAPTAEAETQPQEVPSSA